MPFSTQSTVTSIRLRRLRRTARLWSRTPMNSVKVMQVMCQRTGYCLLKRQRKSDSKVLRTMVIICHILRTRQMQSTNLEHPLPSTDVFQQKRLCFCLHKNILYYVTSIFCRTSTPIPTNDSKRSSRLAASTLYLPPSGRKESVNVGYGTLGR